jgi:signal transduction histidine kinase
VVAEARTHGSPAQRPVTSGEGLAERQVELRALPLPDGRTAVAALDVTAHARAARREDAFVANVSHELRTPLAATLGALRLLAHGLDKLTPEQWPALLEVALRNTERLTELVDDLLHLKELEDGAMPPTLVTLDLHEVAVAVRTELALFASDAGIALRVDGGAAMAWADVSRVHQILVNLVSNAVKFSEPGTVVRVVCGTRDGSGYVDVVDQGRGIPDDQRDTVFRRFGQVDTESDRAAGGTGLGLPLSRALAEQMGGSLDFESREGEGTTFTLSMPTPPFG